MFSFSFRITVFKIRRSRDCHLWVREVLSVRFLLLCTVYTLECIDINRKWMCILWVHYIDLHPWSYSGYFCSLPPCSGWIKLNILVCISYAVRLWQTFLAMLDNFTVGLTTFCLWSVKAAWKCVHYILTKCIVWHLCHMAVKRGHWMSRVLREWMLRGTIVLGIFSVDFGGKLLSHYNFSVKHYLWALYWSEKTVVLE